MLPLIAGPCTSEAARARLKGRKAGELFPGVASPEGALSGLWLAIGCWEEAHETAQAVESREGSYWHGILHRQEPDAANAAYWFRRVGAHATFPALRKEAGALASLSPIRWTVASEWDPFAFIEFCGQAASRPGSPEERLARQIQQAEWSLLFAHCTVPAGRMSR